MFLYFPAYGVRPAVGSLVHPDAFECYALAISSRKCRFEYAERRQREVFGGRRRIELYRAVTGNRPQEIDHRFVVDMSEECVIPGCYDVLLHQGFHAGEIGDHALFRIGVGGDDVAAEGYLNGVTMSVQVTALAVVVRNAMAGIEFKPAGDAHEWEGKGRRRARIVTSRLMTRSCRLRLSVPRGRLWRVSGP